MRAPAALGAAWAWLNATLLRQAIGGLALAAVIVAAVVVVGGGDDPERTAAGSGAATTGEPGGAAADVAAGESTVPPPAPPTAPPTTLPAPPPAELRFLPEDQPDDGTAAPLTGLPGDPALLGRAALAVKIDNLDTPGETALPQTGLAFADVVIEEVVEGGITRFVAVLHSTDAPEVGPIRSARTTDVHLLPVLGRPLFAYSGGNPGVLDAVRASPSLVDRGGEWAPAYVRIGGRRPPHNLYLRPWEIWARAEGASAPPVIAPFRPRGVASPVGEPVQGVNLGFAGPAAAGVAWSWLPEHQRWLRHQRGRVHVDAGGYTVGPRNVVVLVTDYVASPADPRSPEGVTVGGGEALVFTDGKVVRGRWDRPSVDASLALLDDAGRPIALSTGRTWFELVRPGTAAIVG